MSVRARLCANGFQDEDNTKSLFNEHYHWPLVEFTKIYHKPTPYTDHTVEIYDCIDNGYGYIVLLRSYDISILHIANL